MNKAYKRINWKNRPSTATPMNETNMNKMDYALDAVDTRVVELYNQKDAMALATANANKAADSANAAATSANTAAANANEAAQAVLDEKYILTATTEMVRSGTARPTAKGNALLERLTGDSWQKQMSGKNLLPNTAITKTINGVAFTVNEDKSVTLVGTSSDTTNITLYKTLSLAVGTYIFSLGNYLENADCRGELRIDHSDGTYDFVYVTTKDTTFTIAEGDAINFVAIVAYSSKTFNRTIYPMISVEGGDYEPYCGGTASPNPEYPQAIRSVGDSGWFDGEWLQGWYAPTTGIFENRANYVCNKHKISCNVGDTIKYYLENIPNALVTIYYDENGNYLAYNDQYPTTNELEIEVKAQGAKYFNYYLNNSNGVTPSTVGHVCVTINGKYAVIVDEDGGKNKFDINKRQLGCALDMNGNTSADAEWYTSDYIEVIPNTSYHLLKDDEGKDICFYDKNKKYVTKLSCRKGVFVVPNNENIKYLRFNGIIGKTSEIMLAQSSVEIPYTPHQHKRTYIPLDEPLKGIGDVKDEICYQNGLYGVLRRIGEDTFDGSDDETITYTVKNINPNGGYFQIQLSRKSTNGNSAVINNIMSNRQSATQNSVEYIVDNTICLSSTGNRCTLSNSEVTSVATAKTWLANNPITVHYELAEPIFTPFEDQTPFYNLQSFDEVTNVSIVGLNENVEPTLTMRFPRHEDGALVTTAYCNGKKNEIRMDELTAAMLSLNQN